MRLHVRALYDARLQPRQGLKNQRILADGPVSGAGLRFLPVIHDGNQSFSPEEADKISDLVNAILDSNARWIDRDANEKPLTLSGILIIAPYNAQVFELQQRIARRAHWHCRQIQGQEAPIVIYSMTTSSVGDAPRGMEFLFSPNRLNVATSRAKCLCIVVGSPLLFEAECRTPRQMQLAKAFWKWQRRWPGSIASRARARSRSAPRRLDEADRAQGAAAGSGPVQTVSQFGTHRVPDGHLVGVISFISL
jgi:uncharacterized protein